MTLWNWTDFNSQQTWLHPIINRWFGAKTVVAPLLAHWSYHSLVLNHGNTLNKHTAIYPWGRHAYLPYIFRDHFVYATSQWETTLQCSIVSHWIGAHTESDPHMSSSLVSHGAFIINIWRQFHVWVYYKTGMWEWYSISHAFQVPISEC